MGEEAGEEAGEAEVRVRDARSGSSRDFFLLRRERWTLWEAEGFGLPPRMGDWALRAGRLNWELGVWGLEDVLPMLGRRGGGFERGERRG